MRSSLAKHIRGMRRVAPALAGRRGMFEWATSLLDTASKFAGFDANTESIASRCQELQKGVISPMNSRLLGPLEKGSDDMIPMPMVFVLGNHSSGKSTFINTVLGQQVQESGVAPTDDGFTVIVGSKRAHETDGPTMVQDPNLGFGGLQSFGSTLTNLVNLKARPDLSIDNVMFVDSPGMIDSPLSSSSAAWRHTSQQGAKDSGRGYNFPGVVRWFAERADVILLFFDPDKPGTTGETLDCMRTSLAGLEHKVSYVLNKADQFERVHDAMRAYGALCFNLAKVIPRKDMPMIYTTCMPVEARENADQGRERQGLSGMQKELVANRSRILHEVQRAPHRRVDNLITRLHSNVEALHMHATVLEEVRTRARSMMMQYNVMAGMGVLAGVGAGIAGSMIGLPEAAIPAGIVLGGAGIGAGVYGNRLLATMRSRLVNDGGVGLDEVFRRKYFLPLAEQDDSVLSTWQRVKPVIQRAIITFGPGNLPQVKRGELQALTEILNNDVPAMRSAASRAEQYNAATETDEPGVGGDADDRVLDK